MLWAGLDWTPINAPAPLMPVLGVCVVLDASMSSFPGRRATRSSWVEQQEVSAILSAAARRPPPASDGSEARSTPWLEILRPDGSRHGRALRRRAARWWRKTRRRALYASFAGLRATGRHGVESQADGENHRARRDSRPRTASPSRPVALLAFASKARWLLSAS